MAAFKPSEQNQKSPAIFKVSVQKPYGPHSPAWQALRLARAQGARSVMLRTSLAFHRPFPEFSAGPLPSREAAALKDWLKRAGKDTDEGASARMLDALIEAGYE